MRATVRWLPLAVLLCACAPGERNELDLDPDRQIEGGGAHGTGSEEEVWDEPLAALEAGDKEEFVSDFEDHLDDMERWASVFERDIDRAPAGATAEVEAAFQRFEDDLEELRDELDQIEDIEEREVWQERGRELHTRLEQLEVQVRRIDAMRSATREAW